MALGVQYAHGAAARADLERVRDARFIGGVRNGTHGEEDAALGVLNRLVREVSVGINQIVVNQENLAFLSGVPFTRPSTPPSPIYYGVTDPTVSDTTPLDLFDRDGRWVEGGPLWTWETIRTTSIPHLGFHGSLGGVHIPSLEDVGGVSYGSV